MPWDSQAGLIRYQRILHPVGLRGYPDLFTNAGVAPQSRGTITTHSTQLNNDPAAVSPRKAPRVGTGTSNERRTEMSTTIEAPAVTKTPVAVEAERLDRLFPGWYLHIDLSTLDIQYADRCVLAQGAPGVDYSDAIDRVNHERAAEAINIKDGVYAHNNWRADWIAEIQARLG